MRGSDDRAGAANPETRGRALPLGPPHAVRPLYARPASWCPEAGAAGRVHATRRAPASVPQQSRARVRSVPMNRGKWAQPAVNRVGTLGVTLLAARASATIN